ncbi:MAG: Calx-beta domain-containing protein [Steroidobacteraceae bacterium]
MGISGIVVRYVVIGCALLLSACGGGGDGGDDGSANAPPPPPPPTSGIGPAGGTVNGPNGSKVVIPPGALAAATPIAITQIAASATPLPAGIQSFGTTFAFTPHGTTFAVPVTVTLPLDPAAIPAGVVPQMLKTNAQNQWQEIPNAVFGTTTMSGEVTSFSDFVGGLQRNTPVRDWKFFKRLGVNSSKLIQLDPPDHGGIQPGDVDAGEAVSDIVDFGPGLFDEPVVDLNETRPADSLANGQAFGSASGVSYSVFAEAPDAKYPSEEAIGSHTKLKQTQSFVVREPIPTLRAKITKVRILATDFNAPVFSGPVSFQVDSIKGEVLFALQAYRKAGDDPFFYTAGRASVFGAVDDFEHQADDESFSRVHLWDKSNFTFTKGVAGWAIVNNVPTLRNLQSGPQPGDCVGEFALLELKAPITLNIPISGFNVGDEFTLRADTFADTYNRRGGGSLFDCEASSVSAYLRDPQELSGAEWEFTGLEPTNRPEDPPADPRRLEPEACEPGPGPDPAAGELQFEAATFTVGELDNAVPQVAVTRTGGSLGAVTATFATSDGSATAGTDYTALNTTVFFGDGEEGRRIVSIPVTSDAIAELDETVNLSLSEPGGCAALGSRTSAVMKISDDRSALSTQPSGLDPTFDTDGKVTTEFGGDDTGMAIQRDGKIVMVGGSTSDFVLARYNTNGSLDTTFGTNGKVTHSMLTGSSEEIARAVAIQTDGKIVVAGHTGQFGRPGRPAGNRFDHAIVRYNANGSVDTTFGNGGVASSLIGRIFAMALQADGGIIVVGDAPQPEDMMVARYNPNGNLDLTFGEGGFRLFDLGPLGAELAENVAVQSNGAIVFSGPHTKQGETVREQHTAVVRLDSGGDPDASFGTAGVLILDASSVADGLAVQGDGRIVLVGDAGTATLGVRQFATMRLTSNGTPDSSFGTDGRVNTAITPRSDTARSVALQQDGKIVVAGSSNNQANPNFAAVRYNVNGTLDASFGTASMLTVDFFGFTDVAENVAVAPDGKIVLGGLARNNVDGYGLARVNP